MEFIIDNWGTIAIAITLLSSVINAITKHFSEHEGLVKVLLFITEILSILTSLGESNGWAKKAKLPLTSVASDKSLKVVK